jgi:membrane protein YdbS with pleckstrin-like domain
VTDRPRRPARRRSGREVLDVLFENPVSTFDRKYRTHREVVYYAEHPAKVAVLFSNLLGWIAAAGLLVIGLRNLSTLPLVAAGFLMIYLGVKALMAYYTRYLITSMRVVKMQGVLTRRLDWMPLSRITDITFKQNPLERLFSFADMRIVSASPDTGLQALLDVADPVEFHRILTVTVEAKNAHVALVRRYGRWEVPDAELDALAAASEVDVLDFLDAT